MLKVRAFAQLLLSKAVSYRHHLLVVAQAGGAGGVGFTGLIDEVALVGEKLLAGLATGGQRHHKGWPRCLAGGQQRHVGPETVAQ